MPSGEAVTDVVCGRQETYVNYFGELFPPKKHSISNKYSQLLGDTRARLYYGYGKTPVPSYRAGKPVRNE